MADITFVAPDELTDVEQLTGTSVVLVDASGNALAKMSTDTFKEIVKLEQIDGVPTESSTNAVSSGGVYDALEEKQDALVGGQNIKNVDGTSLLGAGNIVIGVQEINVSATVSGTAPNYTFVLNNYADFYNAIVAAKTAGKIPVSRLVIGQGSSAITLIGLIFNKTSTTFNTSFQDSGTGIYMCEFNSPSASTPYKIEYVEQQEKLTFDNTPTADSSNPVKSGGVKDAIAAEQQARQQADNNLNNRIRIIPSTGVNAVSQKGTGSVATGEGAMAVGSYTQASGTSAFAEGHDTKATGANSHAEGTGSEASNGSAHAEGYQCKASGDCSHAEGFQTIASGHQAHAGGIHSRATARAAFAHGDNTLAENPASAAFGKFNKSTTGKTLFAVGAGTSDNDRRNVFEIQEDGTILIHLDRDNISMQSVFRELYEDVQFLERELQDKQDALTFDDTPTAGSSNPVASGGVYDALEELEGQVGTNADAITAEATARQQADEDLQQAVQGLNDALEAKDVVFDFTTGRTAQWANRRYDFRFFKNHWYRVEVLTTDASTKTYFSVRNSEGTSLISNIQGTYDTGARTIEFLCTVDGGVYLYMSYAEAGVAISYNVNITDLSAIEVNTLKEKHTALNDVLHREEGVAENPFTFTKTGKFIQVDGSVGTSNNWTQSQIYLLQKGKRLFFKAKCTSDYGVLVAKTDVSGSFYQPFIFGDKELKMYEFTADEDIYIILQYVYPFGSVAVINDAMRIYDIEQDISDLRNPSTTYVDKERERVYRELLSRLNGKKVLFAFNTDQHFTAVPTSNKYYSPKWILNGINAMADIARLVPLNFIALGGDAAGYGGGYNATIEGILNEVNIINAPLDGLRTIVVSIPGNHDAFQNNANITASAMYNVHTKRNQWVQQFVHSGDDNSDGYIDDVNTQIRHVFIDNYTRNGRTESSSTFLSNALSTLPSGYDAIIISHNPLTNELSSVKKYSTSGVESDAFANPTDMHAILNPYADRIIACICGHSHADVYAFNSSGILFIETTCACPHTKSVFDNIPYVNTLESATETAFDFFVIDKEEKTIEAIRYGQGTNRLWKYKGTGAGLISYKNCLSGSTNVPSVTLNFTDTNQNVISASVDTDGTFEVYLELGKTYTITCDGYTLDANEVTLLENENIIITLT